MKLTHFAILIFVGVFAIIVAEVNRNVPMQTKQRTEACENALVKSLRNPLNEGYAELAEKACK